VTTHTRLSSVLLVAALAGAALAPAGTAASASAPSSARSSSPGVSVVDRPDVGRWKIEKVSPGQFRVSWRSPRRLQVRSDRPTITGAGLAFGSPVVLEDRRTVTALVVTARAPRPATLDVLLSGDRLDEPGVDNLAKTGGVVPKAPPTTTLPAADPALPGPFTTVSSDYTLPSVKYPGMKQPIEMVGHVVEPRPDQVTGPRALVLFLHGRHDYCYKPGKKNGGGSDWPCTGKFKEIPSQLGYVYVQNVLASQGYTTVSIRVNGINAQDYRLDDGGADARSFVVRKHLDYWNTIAGAHQTDLSKTILVGHSRGGEGVDRASIDIPLSAPYKIVGQVLVAPTDFASHTAPYVPTVTLLPYCDGDVSDIQGQKFTDTGRDLTTDDTSFKSSVLVMGANHNHFNTEWTPGLSAAPSFSDWAAGKGDPCGPKGPGNLSKTSQQAVGKAYIAGAVKLFLGDNAYLPLFDGSHVTVPSIGAADVRSHAIGGGRTIRRPGIEASPTTASNATTGLCTGTVTFRKKKTDLCGSGVENVVTPHWTNDGERTPARTFFEMAWTKVGAVGGLQWTSPLDLTTNRLELRTIVDAQQGAVDLRVRITDGLGASALLDPLGGRVLEPLLRQRFVTKLWAQPLLVDASGAAGVNLADIRKVELVSGDTKGRVWVADVSAAPAALAPVPASRMPQLSIPEVKIPEGNPPSGKKQQMKTALVPFTITGTLTKPAQFKVVTVGEQVGAVKTSIISVAPGTTAGTFPITYEADRLDDDDQPYTIQAWGTKELATDDYLGKATITDDDPDAKAVVTAPETVREGQPITITVKLTNPSDDWFSQLEVMPTRGRRTLTGADVPLAFLKRFNPDPDLSLPLWKTGIYLYKEVKGGVTVVTLVIPTRRDGRHEGPETLDLRIRAKDSKERFSVKVVD
jgi:hypothetical protein